MSPKLTRKNFANRPPNFYRGSKSAKFGPDSQNQSPLPGSSFETEQHIDLLVFTRYSANIYNKVWWALNIDLSYCQHFLCFLFENIAVWEVPPPNHKYRIAYLNVDKGRG